jgi:hypothetical protein
MLGIILLLVAFAAACMETGKANKLIDAGNAAIAEANKLLEDANAKGEKAGRLFKEEQSDAEKAEMESTAKAAIDSYEKSAAKYREAAAKFDEASKLKIQDKLKEYLTLKSQSITKNAELSDAAISDCKTVIAGGDPTVVMKQVSDNQERLSKLGKEAADLAAKADKIQQDNKDIFKKE